MAPDSHPINETPSEILELFFKDSMTCFVLLDSDFNFIRVNKAYANVCAKDVSDFPGRNHFEMYPSPLQETFERVRKEKRPWEVYSRPFEFPDHPEWGVTYWDLKLEPILSDDGEVKLFVFSLIDVTKHAVAEQEVRRLKEELEIKMNLFTRIASDWYWELDENLNVKSIGPGYTELTGITQEEQLGKHRPGMRPEGFNIEIWDKHIQDMYNHNLINEFEYPRPTEQNPMTWISISGEPIFDSDGAFKGYRGTGRDITQRKTAELALKESEERLEDAQRIAHLGSWRWNIVDNSEIWSDEQFRIFGYEPGEAEASYELFINAVHPDDRDRVLAAIDKALKNEAPYDIEFRIIRKNGEERFVSAQGEVEFNADGTPITMIGTVLDITERKRIEGQLIQSSKMATLGEMATAMAHEINQPMNVITMAVANIRKKSKRDECDPDFLEQKLDRIQAQTDRATAIINHMRIFGRKSEGEFRPTNVQVTISSVLGLVGEQLRLAGIQVKTYYDDPNVSVLSDRVRLEQVFLNLIGNAWDAIKENGEILIQAERIQGSDSIQISISDTGGGINNNILPRIFDPFFTTKEVGEGTGLGLSISYGIIEEMGGTISAENSDKGAVFKILLPEAIQT